MEFGSAPFEGHVADEMLVLTDLFFCLSLLIGVVVICCPFLCVRLLSLRLSFLTIGMPFFLIVPKCSA